MLNKLWNAMKENKKHLLLPSIIILLPILMGLILWNRLPDPMPVHFNAHNEADGWSSKGFAVFVLPLIVLVLHWLCVLGSSFDKYNVRQHHKVFGLVYWICPVVSLFCGGLMYSFALGYTWNVTRIMMPVLGVLFFAIGNYMPKVLPNKTLGIKLPWTYNSEKNWGATHRFGGKVWVLGGILFLLSSFLDAGYIPVAFLVLLALMVGTPTLYSYLYYKKHGNE